MEVGCPQSLATPRGTIVFNDLSSGNGYLMQHIEGNSFTKIRTPVDNRPLRSGGIKHPFYAAGYEIVLQGLIIAKTPADRTNLDDDLLAATESILTVDGTYSWTPVGSVTKTRIVRLWEAVEILGLRGSPGTAISGMAAPKQYTIMLIGTDPED